MAYDYHIPFETLDNLIQSESGYKIDAYNGSDRGITQISKLYHPEVSDAQAYDPYFAMQWTAQRISAGFSSEWTVCNCWSFVKVQLAQDGKAIPKMANIKPNSKARVGGVVILNYKQSDGTYIKHVAYITKVTGDGVSVSEANYKGCKTDQRFIDFDDKSLVGFAFY